MKKVFVLDTNILIHDPSAFFNFDEHDVVIPMMVLEELDNLKDRKTDVAQDARSAIRNLESVLSKASTESLTSGVPIPSSMDRKTGRLVVYNHSQLANCTDETNPDNIIIKTALALTTSDDFADYRVILVTKDINMRIKAKGFGLEHVEDYKNDQVLNDADMMDKGYIFWNEEMSFLETFEPTSEVNLPSSRTLFQIPINEVSKHELTKGRLFPNSYIHDETASIALRVSEVTESYISVECFSLRELMSQNAFGVKPKCILQAFALHALLDPDIDLVTISGSSGGGKTILTLAAALELKIEHRHFNKIIFTRNTPDVAEAIGFIPGNESEKMAPWLGAVEDTLEAICRKDENPESSIGYITEKANIQLKSLNFIRGRSISDLIIVDEAQNLTSAQIKTITTRIAAGGKLILLGNIRQIDARYLSANHNGLIVANETFKGFHRAAHITLKDVVRSPLAEFAEQNL